MPETASFGYWVRRRRKALDLTQEALARQVGCAVVTIKKIEADKRRPSRQIAERLAERLAIPAEERAAFIQAARGERAVDRLPLSTQPVDSERRLLNNLPLQLTSFIGREKQVVEVEHRLSATRWVTLTGPGGSGKTRLSLQVAAQVMEDFPDGVWLIELASVSDPALVPQTAAGVLGVREAQGRPVTQALIDHLRTKSTLLVLDNCEHLVEACARLAVSLLSACPNLKVLASSREALGASGETTYLVPPLEIPDLRRLPDVADLMQYEAIRLFADRAAAARSGFVITPANAHAVAQICHRLDGIPLAIELAAARIRHLPPQALLARLEDRFQILTGGARDRPARQQTLRRTIDWSYDLLSDAERRLFARLAVFVGGCAPESAEAVCADKDTATLDLLSSLVDKSMLRQEDRNGEPRFSMLETIREYALERLNASDEAQTIRRRHLDCYASLAETAESQLSSADVATWLDRLDAEHDNLRAALDWSLNATDEQDAETGARLAGMLGMFWYVRGYLNEGRRWTARALGRATRREKARAKALFTEGILGWQQGDYEPARVALDESIGLWRELDDRRGLTDALHLLGHLSFDRRDYTTARRLFEESQVIYAELGDAVNYATLIGDLGMVAYHLGEYDAARMRFEESLALYRKQGAKESAADALNRLGELARLAGEYDRAAAFYEESLALCREARANLGAASALHKLGYIAQHRGDYSRARALFEESLSIQHEAGNKQGIVEGLSGLAGLAAATGRLARAARLFAAAQALLDSIGAPLAPADRVEAERDRRATQAGLDEATLTTARAEGQAMTLEQAVAYALTTETSEPPKTPAPEQRDNASSLAGLAVPDRYRLDAEIGRGGMSRVYRAHDTLLDRQVAVKMLIDVGLNSESRQRLLREARAAARLNHPHIVTLFDVGEADGQPFIVMELLEGRSLRGYRPATLNETLDIMRQVCDALDHAHAHGILHRDLKPENVLVLPSPSQGEGQGVRVKLMDFGLAHLVEATRLTQAGALVGTVAYLAPELIQGDKPSAQSDLYALGVMLYELATDQPPFSGEELMTVLAQHLHAPVVPPRAHRAEIPPDLDALVVQLLSKRPAERPASAADVRRMLEQIANQISSQQPEARNAATLQTGEP